MTMDHAAYHVIYVDTRMSRELDGRHLQKSEIIEACETSSPRIGSWEDRNPDCLKSIIGEIEEVRINLKRILSHFNGGKNSSYILVNWTMPATAIDIRECS